MYRNTRSSSGGATAMAIAGIELALWDIKGKFHGVPVYRLVGGPVKGEAARVLVPSRHVQGEDGPRSGASPS